MARKKLSTSVVRRIRTMIAAVLANPKEYDQDSFPEAELVNDVAVCRTPFCAAGHAIAANKPRLFQQLVKKEADNVYSVYWDEEAAKVLGLPAPHVPLFGYASDWPYKFHMMYLEAEEAKSTAWRARKRALAFKARWEHFIASDGDYNKDFEVTAA